MPSKVAPPRIKTSSTIMVMRRNSLTHKILCYTKFYRTAVGVDDITILNPSVVTRTKIQRSLDHLLKSELIVMIDREHWKITPLGVRYLELYAMDHPSKG